MRGRLSRKPNKRQLSWPGLLFKNSQTGTARYFIFSTLFMSSNIVQKNSLTVDVSASKLTAHGDQIHHCLPAIVLTIEYSSKVFYFVFSFLFWAVWFCLFLLFFLETGTTILRKDIFVLCIVGVCQVNRFRRRVFNFISCTVRHS